jgi:dTMP kinase
MALFITFEGIDGSGKTTQLKLLHAYLLQRGISAIAAREPGGTEIGDSIREILLQSKTQRLRPISELLLYYTSRHQNLHERILPALAVGQWVLCDRFADASLAYQGYGRGIDLHFIQELNRVVVGERAPDLTLLLDMEPALALSRARTRDLQTVVDESRFEQESLEFFDRVRHGYLAVAKQNPQRCRVLRADLPVEIVHAEIVKSVPVP